MAKYYDPSATGGTGSGDDWANAYTTLQAAADNVTNANGPCYGRNGADGTAIESLSATVDFDTNIGTQAARVVFIGANADGSPIKVNGNSEAVHCIGITADYLTINGFDFYGSTSDVIYNQSGDYFTFVNSKARNGGAYGINATAEICYILNSCVTNNSNSGIASVGPGSEISENYVADNGGDGIYNNTLCKIAGNVVAGNSGVGIISTNSESKINNNTVDNNGGNGIYLNHTGLDSFICRYNRLTNNGGYGIAGSSSDVVGGYNYFYNNTSGEKSISGDYYPDEADVSMSSDGYTDAANGDYSLTQSAEGRRVAVKFGLDSTMASYAVIGAVVPNDAASGGGLLTHPGMNGRING